MKKAWDLMGRDECAHPFAAPGTKRRRVGMARCAVPVAGRSVRRRNEPRPTYTSSVSFRPLSRAGTALHLYPSAVSGCARCWSRSDLLMVAVWLQPTELGMTSLGVALRRSNSTGWMGTNRRISNVARLRRSLRIRLSLIIALIGRAAGVTFRGCRLLLPQVRCNGSPENGGGPGCALAWCRRWGICTTAI